MNHLRSIVLFTLLAASGCEKTNDLPRLQDEALATARDYQQRFDELAHRAAALGQRSSTLPPATPNSVDARRFHQQAIATIDAHRRDLQQVPATVQTATKSANPDDLPKLIDLLRERHERGVIEATSELAAFETWIGTSEQWQTAPRVPAPAPEPEPDDPPPGSPGSHATAR